MKNIFGDDMEKKKESKTKVLMASYFKTFQEFENFCKSRKWEIYSKLEELMKKCMEKE